MLSKTTLVLATSVALGTLDVGRELARHQQVTGRARVPDHGVPLVPTDVVQLEHRPQQPSAQDLQVDQVGHVELDVVDRVEGGEAVGRDGINTHRDVAGVQCTLAPHRIIEQG